MNDKQADRPWAKRPYGAPTLVRYGNVGELTKAVNPSGKNSDGGMGTNNKT